MKLIETDSGRGCESPQVHQKDFYPKPLEPTTCCGRGCEGCVCGLVTMKHWIDGRIFLMGLHSFDRVKSNEMDSPAM